MNIRTNVPQFSVGDRVQVSGDTYRGPATVAEVAYPEADNRDGAYGMSVPMPQHSNGWKTDQSFPQVRVRKDGGGLIFFNGDDLAAGKVVPAPTAPDAQDDPIWMS